MSLYYVNSEYQVVLLETEKETSKTCTLLNTMNKATDYKKVIRKAECFQDRNAAKKEALTRVDAEIARKSKSLAKLSGLKDKLQESE